MSDYTYRVLECRVIDGDSAEVTIDLGFSLRWTGSVRIAGIDAPEVRLRSQRAAGEVAKLWAEEFCKQPGLILSSHEWDKYGRVLGDLHSETDSWSRLLLAEGLARPYDGGRRAAWSQKELDAIAGKMPS